MLPNHRLHMLVLTVLLSILGRTRPVCILLAGLYPYVARRRAAWLPSHATMHLTPHVLRHAGRSRGCPFAYLTFSVGGRRVALHLDDAYAALARFTGLATAVGTARPCVHAKCHETPDSAPLQLVAASARALRLTSPYLASPRLAAVGARC
mmetsp:Transcript_31212/g.95447  ORF Transcript_31212/g.95447 Transcript_31212/m.95447 type:complete len:151 (-) Transcript_31212:429-881(-)